MLQRWLGGREVTDASTTVAGVAVGRLIGRRVDSAEAWGKHLLIRFSPEAHEPPGREGLVLHSHLRMSGSWHVYQVGDPWRRPARQARLVLTCRDRQAVCFNAPVVELLAPRAEQVHPALSRLGPDVLCDPIDVETIQARARARPPETPLGELLLDQRVLSGIGNIYRCEALFLRGLHPWTAQSSIDDDALAALVTAAGDLMRASLGPLRGSSREQHWVYRRSGRPCRRCGTLVCSRRQGDQARTAYWCPTCQPAAAGPAPPR